METENKFNLYNDIRKRTNGEIYLGVVGPVRTGKSTFIKHFMEEMIIPEIEDIHSRELATDELPQSAAGKTVMTTEPKFIPKEAVEIEISDGVKVSVRMIDCVGFMVDGAVGHKANAVNHAHRNLHQSGWSSRRTGVFRRSGGRVTGRRKSARLPNFRKSGNRILCFSTR